VKVVGSPDELGWPATESSRLAFARLGGAVSGDPLAWNKSMSEPTIAVNRNTYRQRTAQYLRHREYVSLEGPTPKSREEITVSIR